jgi:hypothetical protein
MDTSDEENSAMMDQLMRSIPPMDPVNAEKLLREAKEVFDEHGVIFFLRQGTCLGAVRDHALIAWDDDLDLGSIIDMHGFTEDLIEPVVETFRERGCFVEVSQDGLYTNVKIMKYKIRIDWQCCRVVKGTIAHYPGIPLPVSLFTELGEVEFIGDTYLVPNPPAEYLRHKYGPNWVTPKQVGYEKDVLDAMPEGTAPGRAGWFKQFLAVHILPRRTAKLLVLDENDVPVVGANVLLAGLSRSKTSRKGIAKFYLPGSDIYALAVTANGVEEVLYEEAMVRGETYVYRPDPAKAAGRYFVLTQE